MRTGKIRVFENHELSSDAVLASACLPYIFKAVEIDGEAYWDGGYMGNPAIFPLIYKGASRDVVIVHINPMTRPDVPKTAPAILNRINEISFNSSLMREMRAIAFVTRLLDEGSLDGTRYSRMLIHSIRNDAEMAQYSVASKFNTDWDFLQRLRDQGRIAASSLARAGFRQGRPQILDRHCRHIHVSPADAQRYAYHLPVFGMDAQGSCFGLRLALLQQLERDIVWRADEGHAAVARRPVDRDPCLHEPVARGVDIVDLVGEMAEIASLAVGLRIPVVCQLEQRALLRLASCFVIRPGQEDQSISARLIGDAADLRHPELVAIEVQALVDIGHRTIVCRYFMKGSPGVVLRRSVANEYRGFRRFKATRWTMWCRSAVRDSRNLCIAWKTNQPSATVKN